SEHIETMASGVDEQATQRRPSVLRAAHAAVNALRSRPIARNDVVTDLGRLVLRFLVERTDQRVNGAAHGNLQGRGPERVRGRPGCFAHYPCDPWRDPLM